MKKEEFVPGTLIELYQKGRDGEKPFRIPGEILAVDPGREMFTMLSFFHFVQTRDMYMDEVLFRKISLDDVRQYIAERELELQRIANEVAVVRNAHAPGSQEWAQANETCIHRGRQLVQFLARSGEWLAKMNAAS